MAEFEEFKKNKKKRVINVFVSSTFKDMQAERDELVKKIFPQIRKICEQRGVLWNEVDLRWGITDEQKAEGKVLPICLAEIERCRPYFIGILGERYGWIDKEIPENVLEEYNWLTNFKGKSVTELEILHGVLKNPEMAEHAFFYFRDPDFINSIDKNDQINYLEFPTDDEIAEYGLEKAEELAEERRQKLLILKETIRKSGFPFKENYSDPKTLGKYIYEDLKGVIENLYPLEEFDPLEQAKLEHEYFASSRFNVYIKNEAYFNKLDEQVNNNDLPLVVIGDSGSGKSALLANWVKNSMERTEDEPFIITHYIGATSDSSDWANMLRRIMNELKHHFNIQQNIPDDQNKLKAEFANWLHIVASQERVILIIDALNQLEDIDGALDLSWLPDNIPENIRLIVSSLPGKSLDELKKRKWPTLEVMPLNVDECSNLINDYLSQYKKKLSPRIVEYIVSNGPTSNPLYLRTLLEEIRLHGDHFSLPQIIDHYLDALTIEDLYTKILERYEQDFEDVRENLVKDAFSYLWAARKGLTSNEILDLMGSNGEPLPGAFWYPIFLAAEKSIINKEGLLDFSHDYFRNAVYKRYISTGKDEKHYHLILADYFEQRELGNRKIDELPWQLNQSESWDRLKNCITDMEIFSRMMLDKNTQSGQYELINYWNKLKDKYDIIEAYQNSLNNSTFIKDDLVVLNYYVSIGEFLRIIANYEGSEFFLKEGLQITQNLDNAEEIQSYIFSALGSLFFSKGDYNEAEEFFRNAIVNENLMNQIIPRRSFCKNIHDLGLALYSQGKLDEAETTIKKAISLDEQTSGHESVPVAVGIGDLAAVIFDKGDFLQAETLYRDSLNIIEKIRGYDHPDTATALNNLAKIESQKENYDEAKNLYKRSLAIIENTMGPDHPDTATCLSNLASALNTNHEFKEAKEKYLRAVEINEKALEPNHLSKAATFNNLGRLLDDMGDYELSEYYFRRALSIYQYNFGSENILISTVLNNIGMVLTNKKEYEKAELYYWKAISMSERLIGFDNPDTHYKRENLASLYIDKWLNDTKSFNETTDFDLKLMDEFPNITEHLHEIAMILINGVKFFEAEKTLKRTLFISELKNGTKHPLTAMCLNDLGYLLYLMLNMNEAEEFSKRALEIHLDVLGIEEEITFRNIGNLLLILGSRGKYQESISLCENILKMGEKNLGEDDEKMIYWRGEMKRLKDEYKEKSSKNNQKKSRWKFW